MKSHEIERIAALLSKEHKVNIKQGDGWKSDLQTKTIYYREEDIYKLNEDHTLGLLLHEIGHIKYTSPPDKSELKPNPELMQEIVNTLEDVRIEEKISRAYPNSREVIDFTRREAIDVLLPMLTTLDVSPHEKALLYASSKFYERGFEIPTMPYEKTGEAISTLMDDKRFVLFNAETTRSLLPLAREIEKLLNAQLGQMTEQQKERLKNSQYAIEQLGAQSKRDQIIQKLSQKTGGSDPNKLFDLADRIFNLQPIVPMIEQSQMIGNELRKILKRNNAREFAGRFRSGKLLARRLYRIRARKDNRPFARALIKSNKSYSFVIATDVSGSMFDSRSPLKSSISAALSALTMAGEALRLAKIKRSIIIFDNEVTVKTKMSNTPISFNRIAGDGGGLGGGTRIAKAIKTGIEHLAQEHTERKIMIVFTDGADNAEEVKKAVATAEAEGIEIIGIIYGHTADYEGTDYDISQAFDKKRIIKIKERNPMLIPQAFLKILKDTIKLSN